MIRTLICTFEFFTFKWWKRVPYNQMSLSVSVNQGVALFASAHVEHRVMLTPSPIQQAGNSSPLKAQWKAWSLVCPSP